jgi:hypothetical protein
MINTSGRCVATDDAEGSIAASRYLAAFACRLCDRFYVQRVRPEFVRSEHVRTVVKPAPEIPSLRTMSSKSVQLPSPNGCILGTGS